MALCFPIGSERKLQKWLQENIEKLIMLNKRRRWFHSSRVKLALVSMSASWFLVSTKLIWIIGSKLILSNNQSSATVRVLDTCLIVGLRSLIIILMTASLSSKMHNWDSPWQECVLVSTWSAFDNCTTSRSLFSVGVLVLFFYWWNGLLSRTSFLGLVYLVLQCYLLNVKLQLPCPRRSRARGPDMRNPASNEMDFRLCRTVGYWRLFLGHPTDGDKCSASEDTQESPKLISSPHGRQQTLSLGMTQSTMLSRVTQKTILSEFILCDECMKSILPIVCRMPESILWLLQQICWQTTECLVFQFVPSKKHFKTILWANLWYFSEWFKFFLFELMIIEARTWICVSVAPLFLFVSSQYRSTHFWACPSMALDHATNFAWGFSQPGKTSVVPAEIRDFKHFWIFLNDFIRFAFTLKYIPILRGQEMKLVPQDPRVSSISSAWEPFSAYFQPFFCNPRTPTRTILVFRWTKRHAQFGTFPSRSQ